MTRFALAALAAILITGQAEARPRHHHHGPHHRGVVHREITPAVDAAAIPAYPTNYGTSRGGVAARGALDSNGTPARRRDSRQAYGRASYGDPRPRAWCGWWLRQHLGVGNRSGNLARWWAGYGGNAHGPAVGAIVVWPHHVGIITGHTDAGWVVKSGNDGHAVRERERSLRGVIAFRWPNGVASR